MRRRLRTAGHILAVLLLICIAWTTWRWTLPAPEFRAGDIIFQTSRSQQSRAILVASASLYTHMGMVKQTDAGWMVVEAVGPVKETPLAEWIARGKFGRYALYRPAELAPEQTATVFAAAEKLYGRPYDIYFSFDQAAIYCSELVYLSFGEAGIALGERQKIGDLLIWVGFVRRLIASRAESDGECTALGLIGEACMDHIADRELVTPVSIARDPDLRKVFSNYPV